MDNAAKKPVKNPSLKRKSAARLAAVQCLYKAALLKEPCDADTLCRDYELHHAESGGIGAAFNPGLPPDFAFLRKLLASVELRQGEIERRIDSVMRGDWKKERMNPVLLAVLRAALAEMMAPAAPKPSVLADEYVTLASRLCDERDAAFVNAALSELSKAQAAPDA